MTTQSGGLKKYLDKEESAVRLSLRLHWSEFELFSELAALYERLGTLARITPQEADRLGSPTKLFQVVMCQMYGAASQVLRRRILDAEALTRRAIEATAIAYRLWKHPELCEIYENAYPNYEKEDHPDQWEPHFNYHEAFKLKLLFSEPEPVWADFRAQHAAMSAASTHSGPLATAFHVQTDGRVELQFIESDNGLVRVTWNRMLHLYSEVLMVFLGILRPSGDQAAMTAFEQELRQWRNRAATIAEKRQEADSTPETSL